MTDKYFLPLVMLITVAYGLYIFIRRKIDLKYGLNNYNLNYMKLFTGYIVIAIGTLLVRLVLTTIMPFEVFIISSQTMLIDFILLIIYVGLLEYLLRNGKAKWFLKKTVK